MILFGLTDQMKGLASLLVSATKRFTAAWRCGMRPGERAGRATSSRPPSLAVRPLWARTNSTSFAALDAHAEFVRGRLLRLPIGLPLNLKVCPI
jgi:hypothetical protein